MTLVRTLRRLGESRTDATLMAAAVMLLPPMVVWVSWAAIFAYPWAALLGLAAVGLFLRDDESASGRIGKGRYLVSGGLLVTSLLLYQPGAEFFWVGVTAWLMLGAKTPPVDRRKRLEGAVLFFAVCCACYVLVWGVSIAVYPQLELSERTRIISFSELPGKVVWFIAEPLKQSANLFFFGEQGEIAPRDRGHEHCWRVPG